MKNNTLRPYQSDLQARISAAWEAGAKNVVGVLPTGAGKTVLFTAVIQDADCATVAIAHRTELIAQMSLALARNGIRHQIIGNPLLAGECNALHLAELGRRFVDPQARVAAASVQTLAKRGGNWLSTVRLWVVDEAHHVLTKNEWGKCVAMMPNARGLGVTATPVRADGAGLGRHADGVFDEMIVGPGMRDLITAGFLSDYRIFAPKCADLDLSHVAIGASGDYVGSQLRAAVHGSHLTGDIVSHYLRLAKGKLGLTFTVDIESASEAAEAYRAAGVHAEMLSGKTPAAWRSKVLRAFRAREILQITNCDLLGEGTDVPGIEVVSFARPTESFGLYCQQFGRALRPLDGKSHAIIIDHAGNLMRHGVPDARREWTLDRRDRKSRGAPIGVIPFTSCPECAAAYERINRACPYCGHAPEPALRTAPEFVDGDLVELDGATLARMRGDVARVDAPWLTTPTNVVEGGMRKNHNARQAAQADLRETLALYGGWRTGEGETLSQAHRRFYLTFGTDVMTAQTLGAREAEVLREKIAAALPVR